MYWPVQMQTGTACMHALQVLQNQRTFYSSAQQDIYIEPQPECTSIDKYQTENYKYTSEFIYTEGPIIPQSPYNTTIQLLFPCW